MAKKQTQKKNGRKKQAQSAPFKLGRQGAQAQGAVAAGASDAFEPEQTAQTAGTAKAVAPDVVPPVQKAPAELQAVGDPDVQSLPGQPVPEATVQAFSFSFNVPRKKTPAPAWQTIMVRVLPEDWRTLQALADSAGIPLAAFCREVLHCAAQQAREQGVA